MEPVAMIVLLLAIGTALAVVTARIGLGALPAYLLAGMIIGPGVLGFADERTLGPLATVGATLLLFALGLDLDLEATVRRAKPLAIAGGLQIGLTITAAALVTILCGRDLGLGIALGACLAMSSTLLVLRALDERRLRNRDEGQMALGLSLAQDVALGPLLVLLSLVLSVGERPPWWMMLGGAAALLLATVLLRRVIASALIRRLHEAQIPELQVATAVVAALGFAWCSDRCGLGAALGAFLAGLAFGRDRQAVAPAVAPLQGLTAIIFFAATGVAFDPRHVAEASLTALGLLVLAIAAKGAIAGVAFRCSGMTWRTAMGCGLLVSGVGEFSVVIAGEVFARSSDPVIRGWYHLVVAATAISVLAMPGLTWLATRLLPRRPADLVIAPGDTVVVAGLGPVGNTVVQTLHQQGLPLMLVDRNPHLLSSWQGVAGIRCHLGRIEDMDDWLPMLGHRPALVVLTYPIADTSALVARQLRTLDALLPIVARSPYEAQIPILERAGIRHIICDERETARALLPLVREALGPLPAAPP